MNKFTPDTIANEMFALLKRAQHTEEPAVREVLSPLDKGQWVRDASSNSDHPLWFVGHGPSSIGWARGTDATESGIWNKTEMAADKWSDLVLRVRAATVTTMNMQNSADDEVEEDDANNKLGKYLMNEDDDDPDDVSYVDDEIKDMCERSKNDAEDKLMRASESVDDADDGTQLLASAEDCHMMEGLGKIEASLRRKGEGFAADLVRTTALSIKDDIVKEAAQKTYVLKNLVKMAADLDARGEKKAASMLKMTVSKINR